MADKKLNVYHPSDLTLIERGRPGWRHLRETASQSLDEKLDADAIREQSTEFLEKINQEERDERVEKGNFPMFARGGKVLNAKSWRK